MERLVLEWTASSAESMAKLPPETVRPLSALSPFMLSPFSPPPAAIWKVPSEICKYAPALIPSPFAAMSSAPPEM